MKWVVSIVLIFSFSSFGQNYPYIFELRGLEDSLNNTHLFYRYVYPSTTCWSKNIYHIDVVNNIDTFFIWDSGGPDPYYGCTGQYVYDYDFFDSDPAKFIYGGYELWIDPVPFIKRYDEEIEIYSIGGITEIEISQQSDSLVYAALQSGLYKSSDGGYNFVSLDSIQQVNISMVSLNKNNDSQIFGVDDNKLIRTEDDGDSYYIVDNSLWQENTDLFYDADGSHIYGLSVAYVYSTHSYLSNIYISDDNGNPFTWNELVEYPDRVWISIDELNSGEIYYSAGKQIFKSSDYGTNFNLFKVLPFKITGLYKKSGTDILYASTPLKIYEITPDTINIIKSLPIPDEVLNFYPLSIGNKWIYDQYHFNNGNTNHDLSIMEVNGIYLQPNGKFYYIWKTYSPGNPGAYIFYERIDSSSAKIYKYDESLGLPDDEYLIDDLLAEPGDTVLSYRFYLPGSSFTRVIKDTMFEKWGLTKTKRVFQEIGSGIPKPTYSLTQDIGLDSMFFVWDDNNNDTYVLKGSVIDGVVYGDTTVVSVEDETQNFPTEFSLSQNYPNPFNPSTRIKYAIGSMQFVTLKVYDVLGNEIATLVNEELPAGEYEVEFKSPVGSRQLTSGIYFYQLKAGSFIQTKKMLMIK